MVIWLLVLLLSIFILPFLYKKIEKELEIFLFLMGILSLTITSQWSLHLIQESLIEPIKITLTVFIAGILFKLVQKPLDENLNIIVKKLGMKYFIFLLVAGLGLFSSVITAIISALILVEIISWYRPESLTYTS
ncbi:MAG: DUF1646 family protein [Candidatus Firestonebacteria bacterium]